MESAIVLGATGGTGAAITMELVRRGIRTTAFGRSRKKLESLVNQLGKPDHLTIEIGDAFHVHDIMKAADKSEVIFHCANVPYNEMVEKLIPLGESVMEAAHKSMKKVVVIDGIYPYGRRTMEKAHENHPKRPHTRKGKVRLAYEKVIFHSRYNQALPLIARLPDYYGPTANEASYLGSTMLNIAAGKPAFFIGNMSIPREYVYLPDAAYMVVELAGKDSAYKKNWHIPGGGVISGKQFVDIARQASGNSKPVLRLGRVSLSLLGMFVPVMREIVEMLYLTEEPFVLSGEKYEQQVGPIKVTSYVEGIQATIKALQQNMTVID